MKTIKQQAEVSFQALDFAEKVVMLPIMDAMAESIKNKKNIPICLSLESAEKVCKILSNLGCYTSQGENYEDITKSLNSQEKQEK